MATQNSTNSSPVRKYTFVIAASVRAVIAKFAEAMRAVRLSFKASHKARRATRPLIDITYCVRCGEAIDDGELCDVCRESVARANETNHVSRNARKMMAQTGQPTPGKAWEVLFAQRYGGA